MKMWQRFVVVLLPIVAFTVARDGAAQPPASDGVWGKYPNSMLIKTRTAATYPKDLWVFTLVGLHQDLDHRTNPNLERQITTVSVWAEYGVTDRFQVGVNQPYVFRRVKDRGTGTSDAEDGLGDTSLYAKGKVLKETALLPGITLDGFLKLPVADEDRGFSNGEVDVTLGMEVSKRWRNLSLHINPEYVITGGIKSKLGATADDRVVLNAGLIWHATPKLLPMVEYNGYWWGDVGDLAEVGAGVLWFPTKNTSVKLGVTTPVHKDVTWTADWTPWIKLAVWF